MAFNLDYPTTRRFTFGKYFTPVILVLATLWLVLITLVNVVAVAYETVPFTTLSYNSSTQLWYEKLVPTFWLPPSLVTSNASFQYTLRGYYDPSSDSSENGLNYHNNPFSDCSIQLIEVVQSLWNPVTDQEWIACNTSSAVYFAVSTTRNGGALSGNPAYNYNDVAPYPPSGPLNITEVLQWWGGITVGMSQAFAPFGKISFLNSCLVSNKLASLRIAYYDVIMVPFAPTSPGASNTPAGDFWTLYLIFTYQNDTLAREYWIPITFLPTGEIDETRTTSGNLSLANTILAPFKTILQEVDPTIDVWKTVNWLYVSFYWLILKDFGQIAPTTYTYSTIAFEGSPVPNPNLTFPAMSYNATNNIFINNSLFQIYYSYLRTTILPLFRASLPEFSPLDDTNRLQPLETNFQRTYSCLARQWKGPLEGIVSVLAADYALFFGVYSIVLWLAALIQKRRRPEGCLAKSEIPNGSGEEVNETSYLVKAAGRSHTL